MSPRYLVKKTTTLMLFLDIVDQTQTTLTGLRGPTSKGKGREGREGKERRGGQERPPPLRKFMDPPLATAGLKSQSPALQLWTDHSVSRA